MENQAVRCHFKVAPLRYDVRHAFRTCQWECTFLKDFGLATFFAVVCGNDNLFDAGTEIHGATHTRYELARYFPVGNIAFLVYLQRTEDGSVNVTAATKAKGFIVLYDGAAGNDARRLAAGIGQVQVPVLPFRRSTAADDADFGFEPQVYAFRQIIDAHEGHANAEVDEITVREKFCAP